MNSKPDIPEHVRSALQRWAIDDALRMVRGNRALLERLNRGRRPPERRKP